MTRIASFFAIVSVVLLAGCANGNDQAATSPANADAQAHVVLASASGSDVSGELSFTSTNQGVRVKGHINGLKPNSTHGFHIHENGDCGAPDASSAGGHFNPAQQPHGHPGSKPHHAGDIPNQHADASGVATVNVMVPNIELGTGSKTDVLGRALIVHAQPDDYSSQPSGNAGPRIACGVITGN